MTIDIALPDNFCYLKDPQIIVELAYASNHNFLGRPVAEYKSNVLILTVQAKDALIAVQHELNLQERGYVLKVFDGYRPTTAVADFEIWARDPQDLKMKDKYYPNLDKPELFKQGYIMHKSSHSRGSTVDLTIVANGQELDMGTPFDYFGEKSHTDSELVSAKAQENRQFLRDIMHKHGFKNLAQEWWHYTLIDEPYPDTYFDFPVD